MAINLYDIHLKQRRIRLVIACKINSHTRQGMEIKPLEKKVGKEMLKSMFKQLLQALGKSYKNKPFKFLNFFPKQSLKSFLI